MLVTLPFVLLLAWRFIRSPALTQTLVTMTRLCFLAIFIATGALSLIAAIMRGVEAKTTHSLQQMTPDLLVRSKGKGLRYTAINKVLTTEFAQYIAATSPVAFRHALLQSDPHSTEVTTVITLVIIDPASIASIYAFPLLTSNNKPLEQLAADEIIIGAQLATQLDLHPASTLTLHYPDAESSTNTTLSLLKSEARVAGIFQTGLDEWDDQVAFISFEHARTLFGADAVPVQQINIKLHPTTDYHTVQSLLAQRLHLPALSWYDLNPTVVSALKLEELAMFLILGLIMLITSITTMSLLSMHIMHHQQSIALLYAAGMSSTQLMVSFILAGALLAGSATLCGTATASLLGFLIDHYQLIKLPALYYSAYVPVHMSWSIVLSVWCITIVVSILATWYSARRIRTIPLQRLLS